MARDVYAALKVCLQFATKSLQGRVKSIVNNSAANSHIFLLRHSLFLVYITFKFQVKARKTQKQSDNLHN